MISILKMFYTSMGVYESYCKPLPKSAHFCKTDTYEFVWNLLLETSHGASMSLK